MNFRSESLEKARISPQSSLAACCEFIAEKSGQAQLAARLNEAVGLQPDLVSRLLPLLPAVVKMRDKGIGLSKQWRNSQGKTAYPSALVFRRLLAIENQND